MRHGKVKRVGAHPPPHTRLLPLHLLSGPVLPGPSTLLHSTPVELSKLAELNDSAGGYDWAWQKEAKALKEKVEAAGAAGASAEDGDAKAALKLSMDNILMVGRVAPRQCGKRKNILGRCARGFQICFRQTTTIVLITAFCGCY